MATTPFHLGPGLLAWAIAPRRLDPTAVLVASLAVDVRAYLVVGGLLDGPVHGVFTSIPGGAVVGLLSAVVAWPLAPAVAPRLDRAGLDSRQTWPRLVAGGLVGAWLHVLFDALVYAEVRLLWPVRGNPLDGWLSPLAVDGLAALAGVVGLLLVWVRVRESAASPKR